MEWKSSERPNWCLRSHHDKYLLADRDKNPVSQDRKGSGDNAEWTVEIVQNANAVGVKSLFGKYLTASNVPFLPGGAGKKLLQTVPKTLDSSGVWEPIREGVQVKLMNRACQWGLATLEKLRHP